MAQIVSLAGDWFNTIASVILVNRFTESGLAVGAIFLARGLPPFILGPIAGVFADRFSRKSIMVATDVLRALTVLGFLFVDRAERVWLLYVLTTAQFMISAFFEPARAAIMPSLIDRDELLAANTLSSATWSAMLALGAAAGGVIATLYGPYVALSVDALSFVLSAIFVLFIQVERRTVRPESRVSGWREFLDGLRYVRSKLDLGLLVFVKAMGQVGSMDIAIAVFAARVFPRGPDGSAALGLMFTAAGVGSILGPILANIVGDDSQKFLYRAIGAGYIMIPVSWLIMSTAPNLPIFLVGMAIRSMAASVNWTYSSVLLQIKVPDELLGRVFSIDIGMITLFYSISIWVTGILYDRPELSPRQVTLWLAVASIVPLLIWLASRKFRQPDPSPRVAPAPLAGTR